MPDFSHLLEQTVDAPLSTQMTPVPEGEYTARIDDLALDSISWEDKQDGSPRTAPKLTLLWEILDEALKASMGRDSIRVQQQFILDMTADGRLDTGRDKNVRLGRVVEAVGLNAVGFSLPQLKGSSPALVRIKHRADKNDPEIKYPEVAAAAKLR